MIETPLPLAPELWGTGPLPDPAPLEPDTIYRFEIEVWPTAYLFQKGNRIRLELANGDSMIGDGLFHHNYGHKVGVDTVYHDSEHPSHLVLPVIPRH